MRVLVCPAPFKGVLTAAQAAEALAEGVRAAGHWALVQPLADGGEGTLDAVLARGGERRAARVCGPYGGSVDAGWALLPGAVAVVEMAQASGLALAGPLPRDLAAATSYGTGQLVAAAREAGARKLIVGIGGSATNDGGLGALRALGARFWGADGGEITGAEGLERLERIDGFAWDLETIAACDVDNPLTGPAGATRVFGPQKGGTPAALDALERGLTRYARVLRERFGRDVANEPGAGAAGGLGAALLAFLHATFRPGIEVVMETLGFDAAAAGADLLLTGEGRLDEQSLHGKAIAGVIRHAAGRPVVAVCGAVTLAPAQWRAWGLSNAVAVTPAGPPPDGRTAQAALTEGARHLLASGL